MADKQIVDIKCPYSKLDILLAVSKIPEETLQDETIMAKMKEMIENEYAEMLNNEPIAKHVAKALGITVKELIDSPNYEKIVRQHGVTRFNVFLQRMQDLMNLDHKQAWGLFALAMGLLD